MSCNGDEECDIRPGTVTPKKLPKQSGGGGHEFVTDLPETGDEGVEYVLMDDFSDCSTYRGTFVWNEDCGGWIQTSGSGGGAVERYTFEQTATGWRAKRNNTVIFTYVDKDTIDTYENTADGFQIVRDGVVIFTHTDGGGGDCKEYTITSTDDGWVFKEDGVTKFTYTEPANDPSDGTYFTSGTLTTAITGTTTVAASSVTGLTVADIVIGETLIYDEAGTVGRVTAVNGTNLTVETITTAPGERRGTRLGAVDNYTDLPATCAAAVALGWQTPLAGDFAYVREDSTHDNLLTEYVIQSIDSSCNITWGYSHTLNAGNYVLDLYKYGDYPSGSPIPKNPDGSVTLPKDEDTKYDFETIMDGTEVKGWRVKDHDTGTVLYTYTDQNDNDTYTFEDVTVSGNVVGWRVKDASGTVVYTYTDLDDKSDGTYFTSDTLDTTITNQTTVALSTVSGLTASDIVVGETLIYDGDGTVGVVTAVSGTNLTVDTITVSGSGDASSYVYKTTATFDNTIDNTTNAALSTLSDSAGNTPTASDIIIGKTLAWDDDGTVALAVAISGSDVTFKTMTVSGAGGGSVTYLVDKNGDAVKSAMFKLIQSGKADTPNASDYGMVQVAKNAIMPFHKISGDFETGSTQGTFKVPDGMRVEVTLNMTLDTSTISGTAKPTNVRAHLYNVTDSVYCKGDSNEQIPAAYSYSGEYGTTAYREAPYVMSRNVVIQWTNNTGHTVEVGFRLGNFGSGTGDLPATFRTDTTAMTAKEIGRYVDPIKYLDNSEGLQDTPVGNIISYMGNNVPRHYLACDGTIYNIGDYPALEAHFIEEFGRVNYFGGNGTTTWAVPDLQGEFLRGTGENSHPRSGDGADVGVHQEGTMNPYTMVLDNSTANASQISVDPNYSEHPGTASGAGNWWGAGNPDYKNTTNNKLWRNPTTTQGTVDTTGTYASGYVARPTNTSVKYCIKYESTMQVILGSEQYKVGGTYTLGTGVQVWQKVTLTPTHGDSSLVNSDTYYAPVTGYYAISADTGWTDDPYLWMTWQKRADAIPGNSAANTNQYLLLNNTGNPGGNATGVQRENISGVVYLEKGDPVTLQVYHGKSVPATGKFQWEIVLLTSSVDINEINLIAADDVYSTDEQLVGSYLGKPLYKKTYPLSSTANAMDTVDVTPLNIEQMVKMEALCHITSGSSSYQLSIRSNTGTAGGSFVGYYSSNKVLYGVCDNASNSKKWDSVTVWYTKSTDTAGSAPNKNSLLLTRPDLWQVGTEYDFGGGLYGQRFKGTTTGNSLSSGGLALVSGVAKTAQVKNKGGMVDMSGTAGTNWYDINGGWGQGAGTDYFLPLVTNTSQVIRFYCKNNQGITTGTIQYDIWITYTKS